MTLAKCPICLSVDVTEHLKAKDYISQEWFTVFICKKCGVGFTWPQPEDINQYYPLGYRRFIAPIRWLLRIFYSLRVRSWVREFGRTGRVLEIGCGSGWMLKAFHDYGWEAVGLERTEEEAKFASSITGLRVLSGGLDSLKIEPKYDLILMFNLLEHVADPRDLLRQSSYLLKEEGTIILSMHNLASWQARITGRHWFHLDVPRHLFHFSPQSLANTLELEGLEFIRSRFVSLAHDPYGWLQSLLNYLRFKQNRLTQWLMGEERHEVISLGGIGMVLTAMMVIIPSLLLAVGSWIVRSGAIMEITVKKKQLKDAA